MVRREEFRGDLSAVGFSAARKVGRPGLGRLRVALVVVGVGSLVVYGLTGGFTRGLPFAVVWAVVALAIVVARTIILARSWLMWVRAERGEPTLTFPAKAVAQERRVSGYPMRTVVVRHDGVVRYVHLLFPQEPVARRVPAGPVRLDLFGGPKVHGPGRLTMPDGDVVWAFTSKMGKAVDAEAGAGPDAGGMGSGAGVDLWDPDDFRSGNDSGTDGGDGWSGGSSWGSDSGWSGSGGGSSWGGSGGDSGGGSSGGDSGGSSGAGGGGGD